MIRRSTKSISFLMEFIIVVFFFALSSAICVSVYAKAESMNTKANDRKTAIIIAQNFIESYDAQSETYLTYDKDGNETNKAYFTLQIQEGPTSEINEVVVSCDHEVLISLQLPNFKGGDVYEK